MKRLDAIEDLFASASALRRVNRVARFPLPTMSQRATSANAAALLCLDIAICSCELLQRLAACGLPAMLFGGNLAPRYGWRYASPATSVAIKHSTARATACRSLQIHVEKSAGDQCFRNAHVVDLDLQNIFPAVCRSR